MGTEILPWPFLVLAVLIALGSSSLLYRRYPSSPIQPKQLAAGYLALLVVCAASAAYVVFGPPSAPHDPQYPHWSAFWFLFCIVAFVYAAGTAVVGAPLVFVLSKWGADTVPLVVIASVPVSLCAAALMSAGGRAAFFSSFSQEAANLVAFHALAALCFAVAAGLPWRNRRGRHGT